MFGVPVVIKVDAFIFLMKFFTFKILLKSGSWGLSVK